MKTIKFFKSISFVLAFFCTIIFAAEYKVQDLDYTDQVQTFYNPDRGFYTPQVIHFKTTGASANPWSRFLHLRAEISEFSSNAKWDTCATCHGTTQDLTTAMLDSLRGFFDKIREKNGTVVVRFCYDPWYVGHGNMEPEQDVILKHVRQLSEVYTEYADVISFVELGMYGPYGENHTSKIATPENSGYALREMILHTSKDVDIGARTAAVVARAFGFSPTTIIDTLSKDPLTLGDTLTWNYGVSFDIHHPYFIQKADSIGSDIYRVGLFNDGYLGTQYDYGTWGADCKTSICRERGVDWLETYGKHVPYGGEALTTASGYEKINTPHFLSYEGFRTHTSYLNIQWNNNLIDEWKKTEFKARHSMDAAWNSYYKNDTLYNSGFKFIEDHLGYRYVLKESKMLDSLGAESDLVLKLKIQNVGFGNMTKKRPVTLMLRSRTLIDSTSNGKDTSVYAVRLELPLIQEFDPQTILSRTVSKDSVVTFNGMNEIELAAKLPKDLPEDTYDVFLRISQYGNWPKDKNYSTIRFANDSNYFDKITGANLVGSFVLSKKAPVFSSLPKVNTNHKAIRLNILNHELYVFNATQIEIFDLKGKNIFSKNVTENALISLRNFPKGMLLVRAIGQGVHYSKIITNP